MLFMVEVGERSAINLDHVMRFFLHRPVEGDVWSVFAQLVNGTTACVFRGTEDDCMGWVKNTVFF